MVNGLQANHRELDHAMVCKKVILTHRSARECTSREIHLDDKSNGQLRQEPDKKRVRAGLNEGKDIYF